MRSSRRIPVFLATAALAASALLVPATVASAAEFAGSLPATGAQDMSWVLWVAGALVVAGIVLFALRRRGGGDAANEVGDDPIAGGAAGAAADSDTPEGPAGNN
ncbi:LPXTG cell wall anchor domain-containing protein [uncultured Gulosibacter sp.]|uniref:LPXTG cell wall anchor domain-containing protein n=1 Tax=uncultured Gulosibacter sp. TaxID=1339167 RepID=UPI002889B6FF|nr:LPXTG cell wall anchor domain-containing protein [uncultured Gulosibacter sp.]